MCLTIWVCDLSTKSVSIAFHNGKHCLSQMCHSNQGFIYAIVVPILKSKVKLMLHNCVQSMFAVGKLCQLEIKSCNSLAYIPDPYCLIAMSVISLVGVQAVCHDTGEVGIPWECP